ncbi:hypothetical protein [Sphingomicrobium astaxanthinifaciens]|uniref:hypothetical protein n=1 Tax=Sphingomicrobium astaxanthinifaciens TaxID=1227949 RepID=UPI001FCB2D2E|nr:hypothetical protein [Sphingomicrobium astaxanthinifaciens]MCJ7420280.1 hypothetical protein [Sphingomicrobium astaxanthinifaciens]
MNAPKAFASLSGGLLARKGSARPAMRRQNFGQTGPGGLDDLGWNDMGFEAPAAPSNEEGASVEHINRNPLSGLTPSQPVVHDQQAKLAAEYGEDADQGEYADDGADLEDTTAELWDPEAEGDSPNVFSGARVEAKKADAFSAPIPANVREEAPAEDLPAEQPYAGETPAEAPYASEPVAEEPVAEPLAHPGSRATVFDAPPVSQSTFAASRGVPADEPTAFDAAPEPAAEAADEAPKLMRTVADLAPLTAQQKSEGGAWGDAPDDAEAAEAKLPAADIAQGLSRPDEPGEVTGEDEEDVFGCEEEATAEEAAGDDFDPTVNNRFAAFLSRPAAAPASDGDDAQEEELVLDAAMRVDAPEAPVVAEPADADADAEDDLEGHALSTLDVAQARAGAKDKAAFTLRLDRERHLKLRLACALTGQSAQKMVTEALDRLLGEMTELDELVAQAGVETE